MSKSTLPVVIDQLALSTEQAAAQLGIAPSSLEKDRREAHLGIPYAKASRRVIYRLQDLKDWLEENRYWPSREGEGK